MENAACSSRRTPIRPVSPSIEPLGTAAVGESSQAALKNNLAFSHVATHSSRDFKKPGESVEFQMLSILRAAHILAAALWLGAGAMLTLYIMPSIRSAGAAGGAVMAESMRRGLGIFMASVAGTTILTGLFLYWIWFAARGTGASFGTGGILLLIGALAGVAAAVMGGAILGRTSAQLAELAGAPAGEATQARIAALHERGAAASRIVLALLIVALLLMIFSRSF